MLIKLHEDDSDEEDDPKITLPHTFSYSRAVVWVLIGWAFTLCTYLTDCLTFWEIAFRKSVVSITAQDEMIDSKFVQNSYLTLKNYQTFLIKFILFLRIVFTLISRI